MLRAPNASKHQIPTSKFHTQADIQRNLAVINLEYEDSLSLGKKVHGRT